MEEPPHNGRSEDVLAFWQDRDTKLIVGFVGLVISVAGLLQLLRHAWTFGLALLGAGLLFSIWARLVSGHLDRHRIMFLGSIFAIWTAALAGLGWVPGVVAGGVSFVAVAGALMGQRVMWSVLLCMQVTALIISIVVYSGVAAVPQADVFALGDPKNWFITGGVTLICLGLGTFAIRRSVVRHGTLLARVQRTVELLETQAAERRRLRAEQKRLLNMLSKSWGVRFASAVGPALGHVFNNALTAGLSATETARASGEPGDALEAARVVDEVVASCFEGAGYLLSLARPDPGDSAPADVDCLSELVESLQARLREDVEIELDLQATGQVSTAERQLNELVSLLLTHSATRLPDGGTITLRTGHHDRPDVQTLERGDWIVIEATTMGPPARTDPALVAILAETARRAGAVVHSTSDEDKLTTSVFVPLTVVDVDVSPPLRLPVEDHRALNTVLGLAAVMTLTTAVVLAVDEPERRLLWLGLGGITFAPLIWGALTRGLSVHTRLAAFVGPLTFVAAVTLAIDGFGRPLAVAVLSTAVLAAAAYGSRRVAAAALVLVAVVWSVGATTHAGTAIPPTHTGMDWIRYSVLIPATCALTALITAAPLRRVQHLLETLDSVRERLEAQRVGVRDADEALGELRDARDREDEMSVAGQAVTVLAHDMNNCLTVMAGWASMIRMSKDDPEALADAVDATFQGCRHAQAIVESFGRDDVERVNVPLDLNAALIRMRPMLEALLDHDGQTLEFDLGDAVGWVMADEQLLRRVVLNLITNACAAIEHTGTIRVSSSTGTVLVTDDGHGMDEHTAARALEPLFTTKGDKGTGLGLHSAVTIMQGFGGALHIETEPDAGTTVRLDFVEAEPAPTTVAPSTKFELRRVLIVDDEPLVVESLSRGMRRAGIEVCEAGNGHEALALIRDEGPFDALCCDVVLPGVRAATIVAEFRAANPHARIVLMSGYLAQDMRDSEQATFLHKPFSTSDLLRTLGSG